MRENEFDEAANPELNPPLQGPKVIRSRRVPPQWLHTADTQRALAVTIVTVTLLLYTYLVVAVVAGWIQDEQFVGIIAALAPLQALAAATVGFFFGRRDNAPR